MSEAYEQPERGWTCFHCGETFKTFPSARDHFGHNPGRSPACIIKAGEGGLLRQIRLLEEENANAWAAIHEESADAVKAMRGMATRHATQLREAEELGYSRGLEARHPILITRKENMVEKVETDDEIAKELWNDALELLDRTSPEEYPEMILINFAEFQQYCELFANRRAPSTDGMREALEKARAFIQDEYEQRQRGGFNEGEAYIDDPRRVLALIDAALSE